MSIVKQWWPVEPFKAQISRVIDGDTVVLYIPWTNGKVLEWPMRLSGIDCPEIRRGPTTRSITQGLECLTMLSELCPPGLPITVILSPARDSFGRLLGMLLKEDGTLVNTYMLQHGPGVVSRE